MHLIKIQVQNVQRYTRIANDDQTDTKPSWSLVYTLLNDRQQDQTL